MTVIPGTNAIGMCVIAKVLEPNLFHKMVVEDYHQKPSSDVAMILKHSW